MNAGTQLASRLLGSAPTQFRMIPPPSAGGRAEEVARSVPTAETQIKAFRLSFAHPLGGGAKQITDFNGPRRPHLPAQVSLGNVTLFCGGDATSGSPEVMFAFGPQPESCT